MAFIANLEGFKKSLSAAQGRADKTVTTRYRRLVTAMLYDLAKNTPQWSGDLAASWRVMIGKDNQEAYSFHTDFKYEPWANVPEIKFKGDMEAVRYAMTVNMRDIKAIRWNSVVSIQNVNPSIPKIDEKMLRPGNFIAGDVMAVKFVADKYSRKNMAFERFSEIDAYYGT